MHTCLYRKGKPIRDFRRAWNRAVTAANLPGLHVHDLRRSGVKNLISAGVPEKVAMEISGHRTRTVFDRYHIVNNDDKARALEQVQEWISGSTEKVKVTDPARFPHVLGENGPL